MKAWDKPYRTRSQRLKNELRKWHLTNVSMATNKGSKHSDQHPYLRAETWADGTLVFWNTPLHKKEKYQDFYDRMVKEAGRINRLNP